MLILDTLIVTDFGIDTVQSGLEKLHERITSIEETNLIFPIPRIPPRVFDVPDPRDEPDPFVSETPFFGRDICGRAADQLWQEHLNDPYTRLFGSPSRLRKEICKMQ